MTEPNTTNRPIGVDLFAGVGGLSLGFEQAGFDVVAAVEIDPIHSAAHKFNFPDCAVLPRSVTGLTGKEIRKAAGIANKSVDVVFGGAPCQGFSLIGQRALEDPRNQLVKEYVRIVKELDAKAFVFENVKGLTVGRHKHFLEELIEEFKSIGYNVNLPWRVLNASSYGVPQDRQRLILMGTKKGYDTPVYPAPTTQSTKEKDLLLPRCPTCAEALGDLPDAESFEELLKNDIVKSDDWGKPSDYGKLMRCMTKKAWYFGYKRKWTKKELTASLRTDHTEISRRRFNETTPGTVEPISRFFRLSPDGISNTLRAGTDSARGAFTSPRPIHYQKARCITVREMARLHGFPDWFRFHETKWHGARQIGNAVPPPMARAVAGEILNALRIEPEAPEKTINLEDPGLLKLDMSQASKYWNIPVPIGKRNRKSGAKKRKQEEIEAERLAQQKELAYA